ncbi:MAG: IS21 family transposase [Sphaerochaetaceae bacterium]|jgi:transposase
MQQLNYVEILRLAYGKGMGVRRLAQTLGYPKTTVGRFLQRFKESGIAYPLPEGIGNIELKERLYQPTQEKDPSFVLPDYDTIHKLLSLKGYNLKKLWERYRLECDADGNRPYLYSQFCRHYADFVREKRRTLSLERIPGDEMQVDFTGLTLFLKDDISGDNIPAYVFIAILSYSNYTYLEAMASMNSANWIRANTHALQYFGGVPAFVTPDNAKVAVTENKDWLDPKIQQAYLEWASYYGTVVLPARVRHPKDKSGVEGAVRIVSARILSDLRERTFFSIDEVNNALWEAMDAFNAEPFARKPGSRFSWHQEELGKLSPLPPVAFEFSERAKATVHNDYHVAYDYGYYSAPYELVRQELEVRATAGVVTLYHRGWVVAEHPRVTRKGQRRTNPAHLPKDYQQYAAWSGPKFRSWAKSVGPNTFMVIDTLLGRAEYEVQAFRTCVGILNLAKKSSGDLLEQVCADAVAHGRISYRYIKDSVALAGQKLAAAQHSAKSPLQEADRYVLKKKEGAFSLENLRRNDR